MNHKEQKTKPKNPHDAASRFSKMTFWYLRSLCRLGLKQQITEDDIYQTLKSHESKRIGDRFTNLWEEELKKKHPSVLRMFYKAYGLPVLLVGLSFSICETINRCAQPLFLGALLTNFLETDSSKSSAYFYATGIVLSSLIPVLTFHPFIYYIFEVGMKLKIGASRLAYDKILRMTKSSQVDGLHGRLINLLSNDFSKFDLALCFIHDLWKGPFETILLGYLAYREMGISGIIGIIYILSFVPIQSYIGKMSATFRDRTTKRTDIRVRLMNEIINGIQIIKFYAWEKNFAKIIAKLRLKELKAVRGSSYIMALLYSLWSVSRVSLFLTLISYVYAGNVITARQVFVVTGFYNILNMSMVHFWPLAITFCAEGYVSSRRLKEFLLIKETKLNVKTKDDGDSIDKIKKANLMKSDDFVSLIPSKRIQYKESNVKGAIKFDNVTAAWVNEDGEATTGLTSINLRIDSGNLYAIIGAVGSGKTSLLHAILGELELDAGLLEIHGSLSYANQESFIFEGSVRSNILFTEEYDRDRYNAVVSGCGLVTDFESFEYGDETLVGERGISLSGGQKARVNLARAVYKKADIYLLADPLSAVDSHVGKNIFNDCIVKLLKGKTVLLVTHQVQHLNKMENILIIDNGQITAQGSYEDLKSMDLALLAASENVHHEKKGNEDKSVDELTKMLLDEIETKPEEEKELQEGGTVSLNVYKKYLKSIQSIVLVIFVLALRVINQGIASFIDYFVAQWVNWEESVASDSKTNLSNNNNLTEIHNFTLTLDDETSLVDEQRQNFVNYYIIIIVTFVVTILMAEFSFFYALLRASKNLHDMMFRGLTKTFMQFFNQNPSGRILNRFSKDIGSIDTQLPNTLFECTCFVLEIIAIMILVSIVNVYFLIPTLFMGTLLYGIRHVYVSTSRNVKRVESITRSPIYAHTNATLHGLSTIKALNAEESVRENFNNHLDHNTSAYFMFYTLTRGFAFWVDLLTVLYITVITYTFVQMDASQIPGGNVGLAITQIIGLIGMTQWGIRQTSELENQMVSVERVLEYSELPSEEESGNDLKKQAPVGWPSKGEIEFKDLSLFYNNEVKPAIRNLNFVIKPKEKIGIVGRTGAGKSSIIQALFRMTKIEGKIDIDNIDTQSLTLHELRKNISIIPQDPVLFSGSLRSNLDPFDENKDEAIWSVLNQVELKETISSLAGGLECRISDGGSNFSLGQRQLICLGRALLRKNKILVLDEATASVDYNTDSLIQKTINTEFSECTVLTIAHRLHTVINADKILVMDGGTMVEFDHPHELLKNENGFFTKLVKETSSQLAGMAKDNYDKMNLKTVPNL
ncbi:CLUMA_CG000826, isoform A [Clunio marinus]|uniref:CLUMA_CG000826, isoform A n=1 Tax=Clunio marinus TaxID=568069 RepID=A0A1J1HHQ3_9DIPT|nr:CLUMA_CG000826, isoform A [Clunio marinus]